MLILQRFRHCKSFFPAATNFAQDFHLRTEALNFDVIKLCYYLRTATISQSYNSSFLSTHNIPPMRLGAVDTKKKDGF